jgi:hypothetical protein
MDKIRSMSLATQSCADLTAARVRVSFEFPLSRHSFRCSVRSLCASVQMQAEEMEPLRLR